MSDPIFPEVLDYIVGNVAGEVAHDMVVPVSITLAIEGCKVFEIVVVAAYPLDEFLKLPMGLL